MTKAAWEKDAEDFGRRFRFGEWESALRVARSVDKGVGQGRKLRAPTREGKISTSLFAEAADVSQRTVQGYMRTWQLAAKDGLVPPADELMPGGSDSVELPEAEDWKLYYRKANPKQKKKTAPVQDADVAMLGALSDAVDDMDVAVEASESARLSDRQRVSAEVLCRGLEERIAAIRQKTEPDDLDAELEALVAEGA